MKSLVQKIITFQKQRMNSFDYEVILFLKKETFFKRQTNKFYSNNLIVIIVKFISVTFAENWLTVFGPVVECE